MTIFATPNRSDRRAPDTPAASPSYVARATATVESTSPAHDMTQFGTT